VDARWSIGLVAGVLSLLLVLAAPAESSSLSSSTTDWAYAVAIQRDSRVVAAGLSRQAGGPSYALARYSTKGMLDPSFGRRGKVVTTLGEFGARSLALQPDGKPVVSGSGGLVRYRPDGRIDSSFGHDGRLAGGEFALQKDGKLVVNERTSGHSVLARYTARGTLDRSFGHGGQVRTDLGGKLIIQDDGKIVTASTNIAGGKFDFRLARFNTDGTVDSSFGNRGKIVFGFGANSGALLAAVAIQPDGKIVATGEAGFADFAVARVTPEGALDPSFGDGGKVLTDFTRASNCSGCPNSRDSANALAIQRDGKIVLVGSSDARGDTDISDHSIYDFALARYNDNGSLDSSFGRGGKVLTDFASGSSDIAEAVAVQRNGKLVVAGLRRIIAGERYDFALARYTTTGSLDATFGRGGRVATDHGSG
jgi:uncharacterized delta-60 repeat protein